MENKPESSLFVSICSFPAWGSALRRGCGEQAGKFAFCVLAQAHNGTPQLNVEDRWSIHLGNGNSQASADVPFKI